MCDCNNLDQLVLLMQYTSSHMMIFVGISTAVAAAFVYLEPHRYYSIIPFGLAAFCFVGAGIAIGMIASYIPDYKDYYVFVEGTLELFTIPIKYTWLQIAQNYGFWFGIFFSIAAVGIASIDKRKAAKEKEAN